MWTAFNYHQASALNQLGGAPAGNFEGNDPVFIPVNDQGRHVYPIQILPEILLPAGNTGLTGDRRRAGWLELPKPLRS